MDWNVTMQIENVGAEPNDGDIIKRCLSGESNSYEILVNRYQRPIYNLAYRISGNEADAQDIAQEAFVKAYQSLQSYNPQYSFKSWLFRITQNLSIDQLRKKSRHSHISMNQEIEDESGDSLQKEWEDHSPNARTQLMEKQKGERIEQMIQSLPEPYKSVIILRHVEEMQLEEIAQLLSIPLGTVKTNLYRARNLMKDKLKEFAS